MAKKTKSKPAWPAHKIEHRAIDKLRGYKNNPRTHSDAQVAQLVASIEEWGWTIPILVDEKNVVIAGHGRLAAAEKLGIKQVPVIVARGWSEQQKKAYRVADNQLTLNSDWDKALLATELKELQLKNYDLQLIGFPQLQLVEFMSLSEGGGAGGDGEDEVAERELDAKEKALMVEAWQTLAGEWLKILESQQIVSTNYTKGALACLFLRARFFDADIPGAATLAYNPHRVLTNGDNDKTGSGSIADGLRKATRNENDIVERLWFVLGGQPKLDKLLGTLPFLMHRVPGDFPSRLARSLYDEFAPLGRVLDPCHGWGGRMLGFLLSGASSYDGFDTDPRTVAGVKAIFDDLNGYAAGKRQAWLTCKPFEDAQLAVASYDFALTSPPYFNVEGYGGEQSSRLRYDTFAKWVDGFYHPMIAKVAAALKSHAMFALQVGNQKYPLEESARAFAPEVGLTYVETRPTGMVNNFAETDEADGEVLVMLKKGKA